MKNPVIHWEIGGHEGGMRNARRTDARVRLKEMRTRCREQEPRRNEPPR
jgi:hypothetical protein